MAPRRSGGVREVCKSLTACGLREGLQTQVIGCSRPAGALYCDAFRSQDRQADEAFPGPALCGPAGTID